MTHMRRRKRIPGLLAPLFVFTWLAGCSRQAETAKAGDPSSPQAVAVEVTAASTRPMATVINAQGTLAPGQGSSVKVAPLAPGRLLDVRVREGQAVTAGERIATIDNRPQRAQVGSAAAALKASEAQARQSELGAQALAFDNKNAIVLAQLALRAARLDRDTAVRQAKTALQAAETDLQKTRAGARPQEIAQADQAVNQARATRDRAATELERVQFLFKSGIAPKRQLDDATTALAVATSALESSRQQANLLRAGARAEDIRAAELRVEQAKETARQAQAGGDAKVRQAEAALRQAEQSVLQVTAKRQEAQAMRDAAAQKRADLKAAEATAQTAELTAPLSGIVFRRTLNPGDMADPTTPVVEITDTRALNLLANLTAEDGMKVRRGMDVRVTAADAPGRVFSGRVLSLGQVDPQTNLVTVRIAVANPGAQLKVGTFASADIILQNNPRAVTVPKEALLTRDGKTVLFVVTADNIAHQRQVTIGAEQGGQVEITQGLQPGERVIRLGQYELSDGAKVTTTTPGTAAAGPGGAK